MIAPHRLTASEAARRILAGELTAEALMTDCAHRIEALEPRIKAWAYFDRERAIAAARAADSRRAAGGSAPGLLEGVPVGVKDIFNTLDMPTAMGSPIWAGFTPGNDARAVFNLKRAGALIAGKTVTAEFAVHAPGPTVNPAAPGRIPGTSSSGSAAAVAAGMVPCAIGTQTAGSVIRPASYCGVWGMKPSFGLIPRTGMLKTTDPLDTVGFFARAAADLGLLWEALRVRGMDYPISERRLAEPAARAKGGPRWKIAIVKDPVWAHAETGAKNAFAAFTARLAREKDIELSEPALPASLAEAHEVHATIYDKSLAYYFKDEYQKHTLISREIKEMIEHGNTVTLETFTAAIERQDAIAREMDRFLEGVDALVPLSTAGEPPPIGQPESPDSCLIWTLCGLPAVSAPLLEGPSGFPVGVQLVARRYWDPKLLAFAERLAAFQHQPLTQTMETLR